MTARGKAILLLLRCLNTEPEVCPAAVDAAMRQPDLAAMVQMATIVDNERKTGK